MYIRKLWFLIAILMLGSLSIKKVYADNKKNCPSVRDLAKTLILMELHGRRAPKYYSCLKKVQSKYLWVRPEQNDEALNVQDKIDYWVDSIDDLNLTHVSKMKVSERYKINYSYKVNNKMIEDDIVIETHKGNLRKLVGCASIVSPPKNLAILKNCKNKH